MNTVVTLDECEDHIAHAVGRWRVGRAVSDRLGDGHGEPGIEKKAEYFDKRDLPGAVGEIALAKALNLYWGGDMNAFGRRGDVGGYEARATEHPRGHLVAYPEDKPDLKLVLVIVTRDGRVWRCRLAGWLTALEAKRPEWLKDGASPQLREGSKPQYWVPQARLYPMESL